MTLGGVTVTREVISSQFTVISLIDMDCFGSAVDAETHNGISCRFSVGAGEMTGVTEELRRFRSPPFLLVFLREIPYNPLYMGQVHTKSFRDTWR